MTSRVCRTLLVSLAFVLAPAPACAQAVTYARVPGDTLRFREVTRIEGTTRGRAGNQTVVIDMQARISLAFVTPDSARAWYDSLAVTIGGVGGNQQVATRSALQVPFVLRVRPTGAVETVRTPELPAIVRDIADYTPQFDDFLARLPATNVESGATWTDTVFHREQSTAGRELIVRRIIHSQVDGDTTVAGRPALRIRTAALLRIESTIPIQRQAYTAKLVLNGTETGFAIVSRSGHLLSRERTGEFRGSTKYTSGATELSVTQTYTLRSSLTAADPR